MTHGGTIPTGSTIPMDQKWFKGKLSDLLETLKRWSIPCLQHMFVWLVSVSVYYIVLPFVANTNKRNGLNQGLWQKTPKTFFVFDCGQWFVVLFQARVWEHGDTMDTEITMCNSQLI